MYGKLRNMTAIYLMKGDKVLLLYRQGGRVVNNVWVGSAGGHFEKEELNDAQACVLREMKEELGLQREDITELALRYIALRSTKGEIRQTYYFFAKLKENVKEDFTSTEGICKWFSLNEVDSLEMPVTAKYVMEHFCREGRFTNDLYVGTAGVTTTHFQKLEEF